MLPSSALQRLESYICKDNGCMEAFARAWQQEARGLFKAMLRSAPQRTGTVECSDLQRARADAFRHVLGHVVRPGVQQGRHVHPRQGPHPLAGQQPEVGVCWQDPGLKEVLHCIDGVTERGTTPSK